MSITQLATIDIDIDNINMKQFKSKCKEFIGEKILAKTYVASDMNKIIKCNNNAFYTIRKVFAEKEKDAKLRLELFHKYVEKKDDITEEDIENVINNNKSTTEKIEEVKEKFLKMKENLIPKIFNNTNKSNPKDMLRADYILTPDRVKELDILYNSKETTDDDKKFLLTSMKLYQLEPTEVKSIINSHTLKPTDVNPITGGADDENQIVDNNDYLYEFFNKITINDDVPYKIAINNNFKIYIIPLNDKDKKHYTKKDDIQKLKQLNLDLYYYVDEKSQKFPNKFVKHYPKIKNIIHYMKRPHPERQPERQPEPQPERQPERQRESQQGGNVDEPTASTEKVEVLQDLENIRNHTKKSTNIDNTIKEIINEWDTYKTTVPAMNFNDASFYDYIYKLNVTFEKLNNSFENTKLRKNPREANDEYEKYIKKFYDENLLFRTYITTSKNNETIVEKIDEISKYIQEKQIDNIKKALTDIEKEFATSNTNTYTNDDIIKIKGYFQNDNGKNIKTRLAGKFDSIIKDIEFILKSLLDYSKKYASLSKIIKIDILEKIEPKNLGDKDAFSTQIINNVNELKLQMLYDIDTMINAFQSRTVAGQKGGGGDDFFSKITANREKIEKTLSDIITNKVVELKKLHITLYNTLLKLKDPTQVISTGSTNYQSIFNVLYKKYIEDKTQNNKTEYEASSALIDSLEQNNVLPKKVLKVDFRDNIIFIATTLIIRLTAVYLIEVMIDKKYITKLDSALFGFLTIFTILLIILVIIVNIDDYKMRIIYNYVNLHSDPSNIFTYISLLWIFGAIIYFVMNSINSNTLSSAANDEERSKLKYKIQVITMIIWVFLSISILAV